ncbi:MAG: hypothetical protein PHR83_11255 [Paludibacter sp.]|nr:hypothetical protein [Paludibacter sp.]
MKRTFLFIPVLVSLFLVYACDTNTNIAGSDTSGLIFKTTIATTTSTYDSVVFLGSDIQWFNVTTRELRFKDSLTIEKIRKFNKIKFYLGTDSLFTAITFVSDVSSKIIDDIVLHLNHQDGQFHIEDGYPSNANILSNPAVSIAQREKNKNNRATAWNRFIEQLKKNGQYKE